MNIRDMTYIIAVDKHQHFGKASLACHVSQPTLSGQIKKMEEELGVILFERDYKAIRTTPVGRDIIDVAKQAMLEIDKIKAIALASQDPLAGHIKLGFIPTIAPYLIPLFVSRMSEELPNLNTAYQEDITDRLNAELLSGDLDAAILATEPENEKLEAIPLYKEPFWLVYPTDHEIGFSDELKIADLPIDDMLLLTDGHCFRDQALSICKPRNKARQQSIRATGLETLINMVAAKQGVTLVPALALRGGWTTDHGVQARRVEDDNANRTIYLTYRKSYPRKKLIEALTSIIVSELPNSVTKL